MTKVVDHFIALRELTVSRVTDVGPRLRRITLTGEQLEPFEAHGIDIPAFRTDAPDDHVKLFFPPPNGGPIVLPVQADGHLDWPEDHSVIHRDYTVRRYDAEAGEVDIELVLHGDGVASQWAADVQVGQRLHLAGPRGSRQYPTSRQAVLVGDLTALPAIARWIEEAPSTTTLTVVVRVTDVEDEIELRRADGTAQQVIWLHDGEGRRVVDVVAALPPFDDDVFVFVAAELSDVADVKRHLVAERELGRDRFHAISYWRQGGSSEDDHLAGHELWDLADLLTPYAVRVAATLRLADHVVAGVCTTTDLASKADADRVTIDAIVRHLATKQVFTVGDDGTVGLGRLGAALVEGHESGLRHRFDLHEAEGRMGQAFSGLFHTATTGTSGYEHVFGVNFWDDLQTNEKLGKSFDGYIARWAAAWVPLAREAHDWSAHRHLVDVGGGIGLLLVDILKATPEVRGTLVELPTAVETARWLFEDQGVADRAEAEARSFFDPLPSGDAMVLAQVLHDWPDDDAIRILQRCADAVDDGGTVLVLERIHDGAGENVAMTLLMRNLFAGAERDVDDFSCLGAAAGLELTDNTPVGYGLHLLSFAPNA